MIRAFAVPQVRAVEGEAMDRLRAAGEPDGELMGRAAEGLAGLVSARAAERGWRRVVVLAGPGDNGGDALHAAALLSQTLAVAVIGVATRLHEGGERAAYQAGVLVHRLDPEAKTVPPAITEQLAEADVVVDGLVGIGGRPGLSGAMAAVVSAMDQAAYVVAVDLPSGADPAGQEPLGAGVLRADETVTFSMAKPVHLLPATEPAVGLLTVVDIGVEPPEDAAVERLTHDDVRRLWPVPGAGADKYSRGVLGVVAGSGAYPGAAVMCCTAAVESGAGMVRYVGPPDATDHVVRACPEVVPGQGQAQAWVLGPGLPPDADGEPGQTQAMLDALDSDLPCVVDAGALEMLADWLSGHGGSRQAPTLLTPHAGEAARLLTRLDAEVSREQVSARPVHHARRIAELTGCAVLLKGATTLVVPPSGAPVRSQRDAPHWLATAGAGDVLAGVAGVLLAAGLSPLDAGSLAALVHGVAADQANPGGPVRAMTVAHAIPGTVAGLLRG